MEERCLLHEGKVVLALEDDAVLALEEDVAQEGPWEDEILDHMSRVSILTGSSVSAPAGGPTPGGGYGRHQEPPSWWPHPWRR